jgi:phosphate/sulfate permease
MKNKIMITTKNSTKLEHHLTDSLTGIYISLVLFVILVLFVSYFMCLFCKKRRANANKRLSNIIDNASINHSESLLPIQAEKLCESRKNSEFIDYLIAKQQELDSKNIGDDLMISRKNSLMSPASKNQLLSSRVSLILLSSAKTQLDNYTINDNSERNSIEVNRKVDQDTVDLVKKFLNSPKLDKETANRISFKIAKYYENNRKIDSLSSVYKQSISRSRSILSLNTDINRRGKLRVSFKYDPSQISKNDEISKNKNEFKRRWMSEKPIHKKKIYRTPSKKVSTSSEFKKSSKKKPTTIYELYKTNKMQISNLLTNYDSD